MLPSIHTLLDSLGKADRLMSESLGFEMDYHRSLEDMDTAHFIFTVTLVLRWPNQLLLGPWPDTGKLSSWMNRVREDLFFSSGGCKTEVEMKRMVDQWDLWAKEAGLTEVFAYVPMQPKLISPLLDDLRQTSYAIGGTGTVRFNGSSFSSFGK